PHLLKTLPRGFQSLPIIASQHKPAAAQQNKFIVMSSKKRSRTTKTNKLFTTLHSLEETDARAAKKRKQSLQYSVKKSKAANDESKIQSILVELRILTQRSSSAAAGNITSGKNGDKVKQELDGLLENLLVARRELMSHQLDEDNVDYSKMIQEVDDENSSDDASSSNKKSLASQLQDEYNSLQTHWQTTLNKHHSNLALHSGLSVATSKFQSKAVDLSFWDQVKSSVEHDRVKGRGSSSDDALSFDDSKLYQQMLKDFISSGGGAAASKKGTGVDPAQDAAERLKRAMRKKSGGDVDLNTLLDPEADGKIASSSKKNTVDRKASKGRKIRYVVHPKLVNFMFPVARKEPMISDDVWFKSLFGGVGR
ncbi:hypothetical protein ACHAWO_012593, partial [Cyclotella atomus]